MPRPMSDQAIGALMYLMYCPSKFCSETCSQRSLPLWQNEGEDKTAQTRRWEETGGNENTRNCSGPSSGGSLHSHHRAMLCRWLAVLCVLGAGGPQLPVLLPLTSYPATLRAFGELPDKRNPAHPATAQEILAFRCRLAKCVVLGFPCRGIAERP